MSTSEIAKLESRWRDNPHGLTFAPLAEAYRKQKDPRRALEILQPGLERHPDYIPANIVLGRCHWDLSDLEAAEKAFAHVLALDGENVIALKALADITERQSRPHEAERWLEALLSVDRSNEEAREQLARIRAVQSVAPLLETPAGLDEPSAGVDEPTVAVDEPHAGADEPRGGFAEPLPVETPAASAALLDPFPAIADQLDRPEPESPEPEPAAWVSGAREAPAEPAAFPDLADFVAAPAPASAAPEPEASVAPDPEPFAAPPLPEVDAFRFERAEEIVLNVSSSSEFQAPSAADDLASVVGAAPNPAVEQPGHAVEPPGGFQSEEPPPPSALFGSYLPDSSAATSEPPAFEAPAYEPPSYEAPVAELLPAGEPASAPAEADPPDTAEPDLVVTETMAQVFLRQGHVVEALAVYRELAARAPASERLRERVTDLEARQLAMSAPAPRPSFLARDTGGQSLGGFFSALLAARLESAPSAKDDGMGGVELSPETAPATRPAEEPLSLGSVFGEDPPAVAPAVPPAGSTPAEPAAAEGSEAVSFDDFFAGSPVSAPAPAPPTRPSRAKPDDDLDQFHNWLQGLKR